MRFQECEHRQRQFERFLNRGQRMCLSSLSRQMDVTIPLPEELGTGFHREILLCPGLTLMLDRYTLKEPMKAVIHPAHCPLAVSVCLSGTIEWIPASPMPQPSYTTSAGQVEMSISGSGQDPGCRVDCMPDAPIVFVSLILEPDRLVPLVRNDDLTGGTSWKIKDSFGSYCYCKNRLCPSVEQIARHLLNFNAIGRAQRLYGLAKALELLALTIGPSCPKESPDGESRNHRTTASEKQQLYKAKEIIDENYTNPPMLPELARLVGTNQTKLKRSFKRLFGVCISGYLLKRRMEKGYQLLQTGEMNVSEVALHLGYANRSHFTRAFTRQYRCTPKSVLQNARSTMFQ